MSTITLTQDSGVAHLIINRAEKHNALTQSMWQAIADVCERIEQEIKPRVLVVSGAGGKAFSAGADIHELADIIQDPERLKENSQVVRLAQQKLEALSCATIAQISGVCVGGGMGIALACDFRLCDEKAVFAITPSKLGLLYSIEDTRRLVNIVGLPRAKELLYLGKKIDADTAEKWSLVTKKVPVGKVDDVVKELTSQLLAASGSSVAGMKRTLAYLSGASMTDEQGIRLLFDQAFGEKDFKEGAQAFLEKRKPEF